MSYTLRFEEPASADQSLVGGKGVNLARLSQAGFRVPDGFTVTTDAYAAAITSAALADPISQLLQGIDYEDMASLESSTARIRELIENAPVPDDVAQAVRTGYAAFGEGTYVAVRSSGTAEDLADTSFAGQHDTYLDVRGEQEVLDAVRRCWASMWSARATAYRQQAGISHDTVRLAVVVQLMVGSEVSGVMFTGNPVTAATDEIIINASYGLGEGIVSGILTPDQFTLAHRGLTRRETELGTKEKQVVRNPDTGLGVVELETDVADRERESLDDAQLRELGKLGKRVQKYYGGIPQDIEWAIAGGDLYLLQSRDITGVNFSWDEELDVSTSVIPASPHDTVWTRAWSDSVWPGAVTPLFFSIRIQMIVGMHRGSQTLWGTPDIADMRPFRYHKARTFYNTHIDAGNVEKFWPPFLRAPELFAMIPPTEHQRLLDADWSWAEVVKVLTRIRMLDRDHGPFAHWGPNYASMELAAEALGLGPEECAELDDDELLEYLQSRIEYQKEWIEDLWTPFFLFMPIVLSTLMKMVGTWYRGTNPMIFSDLITGLPEHTITLKENVELWNLAQLIRENADLRAAFDAHPGAAFFSNLPDSDAGREFSSMYAELVHEYGHRGHAERDMIYARRVEDPAIDYRNFQSLLTADEPPDANIDALIARRKEAEAEMEDGIRQQSFGAVKLEAFKVVHDWILKFFMFRDDERHHTDRVTMSKKWPTLEIAKRLQERGVIEGDEFWFLSIGELSKLLEGAPRTRLHDAQIAGRRANYEAVDTGGFVPPMYLQGHQYPQLDAPAAEVEAVDGVWPGLGTSRGEVTGTARVIPTQADIGRVQKGDILITHATDPGWTPVFMVLSGLVLETGGMLCHGSCISREYGIPAVQLGGAMTHIPDGATITVNGDTGTVTIVEVPDAEPVPA